MKSLMEDDESSDCSDSSDTEHKNSAYFSSYENLDVHRLMLNDRPRTESYRKAILENRPLFDGKIVMDVGSGTGILSLFAADAGARKVYSVEASSMSLIARDIVRQNNLENIIEVFSCPVEDFVLPNEEKVDVLVSEWMGFYLLHESMLDSVILARDKFLKDSGVLFPFLASIYACPANLHGFYREEILFWDSVYGYDYSVLKDLTLKSKQHSPQIMLINNEELVAKPELIKKFDLKTVGLEDVKQFKAQFFVSSVQDNICRGLVLWFDCEFPCSKSNENIVFSTAPSCAPTHWKQTVIVLPSEINLDAGDVVGFEVELYKSPANHRHYSITVEVLSDSEEHPIPCNCGFVKCKLIQAFLHEQDKVDENEDILEIS